MTLLGCVLYVELIACFGKLCLFLFICFFVFTSLFLINFFLAFLSKIQKHIKSRKSKKFDHHCWVLSLNMFYLVPLCKWLYASSSPMHSYYCGRNLEVYVTIVNRSSSLSWMISEWFCWSWDMHRLVSRYLPTLYLFIYLFC